MSVRYGPAVLAELTFGQEVWLAVIPAAGILIGVLVGVWQARKAWGHQLETIAAQQRHQLETIAAQQRHQLETIAAEQRHQRQIERDKVLRAERISFYRRLVETTTETLELSAKARTDSSPGLQAQDAVNTWSGVYGEAQMIGSSGVIDAARRIDAVLKERRRTVTRSALAELVHLGKQPDEPPAPSPVPMDTVLQTIKLMNYLRNENETEIDALITACGADIASLGESAAENRTDDEG